MNSAPFQSRFQAAILLAAALFMLFSGAASPLSAAPKNLVIDGIPGATGASDDKRAKPEDSTPPATEPLAPQPIKLPDEVSKPAEKPIEAATLLNWFNDLGHRDAAVRDEARVHLMSMGRRNLETFQKIVEGNRPLAPSQATALRQIVSNVYLSGETYDTNGVGGFLGIRMQQVTVGTAEPERIPPGVRQPIGVVIVERMAGFCGARMLMDGDVILNIAEHPVKALDPDTFVAIVAREMHAGQTVHFELLRQGQVMRVPVTLDPRPDAAEPHLIQEFLNLRSDKFEAYWETSFKPLVEEGVG